MRRIGWVGWIVIVIATLINRKKIMRMCGSSEKEWGGFYGKMADGQEKERVIIEKEKERKKGLSTSEPLFKPRSHPQNPHTPRHKQ